MKAAIYVRTSTKQTDDTQLNDLKEYVKVRGLTLFCIYQDKGRSSIKKSRPALNSLMDDARERKFDIVLVWKLERFARSVKHLADTLRELGSLGIKFISYRENIDTSTPIGEVVLYTISVVAEIKEN